MLACLRVSTWQAVHVRARHGVSLAVGRALGSQWQHASVAEHLRRRTACVAVAQVAVARGHARYFRFAEPVASTRVAEPRLGACASR